MIGIIGVLSTIVLVVIIGTKYQARDAKRLAELRSIGTALELYRLTSGHYPIATGWVTDCGHAGDNWIPDGTDYDWNDMYLPTVPRDPSEDCAKNPAQSYQYWSNGEKYQIIAQLEGSNPQGGGQGGGGGLSFDGFSFQSLLGHPITATLSSSANDPTNQSPIPFTVTFSQTVVDFTQASLSVVRGFVSGVVALSQAIYNFFVTPTDNDTVVVTLNADTVHTSSGQGNEAAQYSITYDSLTPHLALSPDPLPSQVSGAFSVALNSTIRITDFSASSVSVSNGSVSGAQATPPLDGRNYAFTITPAAPGTVTVAIPAGAVHSNSGQANAASNTLITTYAP